MDYNEAMKAALLKTEGYAGLSGAAKELLGLCAVLDLKNACEGRARLEGWQKEKGFDDVTLWGTVALAAREARNAGLFKQAGIDMDKKLFTAVWSDALKKAALEECND